MSIAKKIKEISKIFSIEGLVIGFIYTLLCTVIFGLYSGHLEKSGVQGYFIILTITIFLCFVFFTAILYLIKKELKEIVENNQPSLNLIGEIESFNLLIELVDKAKKSLIFVGDGYSKLNNGKNKKYIINFFNALNEKVFSLDPNNSFEYLRVTNKTIPQNTPLFAHIKFILGNTNKNSKVAFLDNLDLAYTYSIIDDEHLFIHILNNPSNDEYETSFYTSNKVIITHYMDHFKRIESSLKFITDINDFEIELVSHLTLESAFNALKEDLNKYISIDNSKDKESSKIWESEIHDELKYLSEFTRGMEQAQLKSEQLPKMFKKLRDIYIAYRDSNYFSICKQLAIKEINQAHDRIMGLKAGSASIDHFTSNGKLSNLFINLLGTLKSGDEYLAVSVHSFWRSFDSRQRDKAFKIMESLLSIQNVKFKRYYLLDALDLENPEIKNEIIILLKKHLELKNKIGDNYEFGFCVFPHGKILGHQYNLTHIVRPLPFGGFFKEQHDIIRVTHLTPFIPIEDFRTIITTICNEDDFLNKSKLEILEKAKDDFIEIKEECERQSKDPHLYINYNLLLSEIKG